MLGRVVMIGQSFPSGAVRGNQRQPSAHCEATVSKRDGITDEDRALFRRAVDGARPLAGDRAPPPRTGPTPRARDRRRNEPPDPRGLTESEWTSDVAPGDVLSFARPGVQRREIARLRRGRFEVEADLDLHGRTVIDAVAALARFLEDSRRHGRRCVRIVHGKGFGSPSGRPVMKANVDRWLRARSEVLAFCSATPPDGGTGALYVLLRR